MISFMTPGLGLMTN